MEKNIEYDELVVKLKAMSNDELLLLMDNKESITLYEKENRKIKLLKIEGKVYISERIYGNMSRKKAIENFVRTYLQAGV